MQTDFESSYHRTDLTRKKKLTLILLTFTEIPGTVSVRLHFDESSTLT